MGLKEEDIIFTRKDEAGNTVMRFPITRVENVERAVATVDGVKPASGNVTLPVMTGASATAAGKKGDVPAPAKGDQAKALLGSGKFGFPSNLATTRYFNGVAFNGGSDVVNYGVCSTAAATAAKVVACTGFALKTGARIAVKFTVTNTVTPTAAAPLTLNVNNTGAKNIFYHGSAAFTGSYLSANRVIEFIYDGTQYAVVGDWDTNTRYSNMKGATASEAGTAGLVPAPAAGAQAKFLRGDGTWQTALTAHQSLANYLKLTGGTISGDLKVAGKSTFGNVSSATLESSDLRATNHTIRITAPDATKGTVPTSNIFSTVGFFDKAGFNSANNALASLQHVLRSNKVNEIGIYAFKPEAGSASIAYLTTGWNEDGQVYVNTNAPINSSVGGGQWVQAANGVAVLNSMRAAGTFIPLWNYQTTDGGSVVLAGYQNNIQIAKLSNKNK